MVLKDQLFNKRIVSGWENKKLPKLALGSEAIQHHYDEAEEVVEEEYQEEGAGEVEAVLETPKSSRKRSSKKQQLVRVPKRKKPKKVVVQEVSEGDSSESDDDDADQPPLLKYTSGGYHTDVKVDPCDVGGFFVNGKHNGLFIGGHCTPAQLKQMCGGKKNFLISLQFENNTLIKWAKQHPIDLCGGVMRSIDTQNLLAKQFQPRAGGNWPQQQQQPQWNGTGGGGGNLTNFQHGPSLPLGAPRGMGQLFGTMSSNHGLFQPQ